MKTSNCICAAILAATLFSTGRASAEPLVRSADLSAPSGAALLAQIAKARRERPAAFEQVRQVRADAVARDRQKRGRVAHVSPALRALGADALLPMLGELLEDPAGEPEQVTLAMRLGLLQAIGELRDARALPVLVSALDRGSADPRVARTAAAALGALATDEAVDALLARAATSKAAITGLGAARRAKATGALAAMLDGADEATAGELSDALGDAANEWAWQTSRVAASGEREVVVGVATTALARAFVARSGGARARAERGLRLAGPREAIPALRAARVDAAGSSRDAVDALLSALERSPGH